MILANRPARWALFFILWALQGIVAAWQFIVLPTDVEGAGLFGLSPFRLAGITLLLSWILLSLALSIFSMREPERLVDWLHRWRAGRKADGLLVLAFLLALTCQAILAILWGLSQHGEIYKYGAYAARLAPLLTLASLVCLELIAWLVYSRRNIFGALRDSIRAYLKRAVLVWIALGLLVIFIMITGLGIVPDNAGDWGYPGVPLLEWQIALACAVLIATILFEVNRNLAPSSRFDFWSSLAIWLAAAGLWLSQPVVPGSSTLAPRAPNFEIYPFADAQVYDEFAQSLLIGHGLQETAIPSRPLYVVLLAFFHLVAGQKYDNVIALQSLLLAFFPVSLYWIGKVFYGRPLGFSLALLAILRDITSNYSAPFTHALSYTKLYLSEIPVAIPIIVFMLVTYRWARSWYPAFPAFVAGGFLGIGIMIRTQALMALPVMVVIAWLVDRKAWRSILSGTVLMFLAIALVISPWIWRNWRITGEFIFDEPRTQTANLALRYNNLNGVQVDLLPGPGESNTEFNNRLFGLFVEAVRANPGGAFAALTNRFLNNGIGNLLILPLRNDLLDLKELWQPSRPFWEQWKALPTPAQSSLIAFYLLLLGLGLASAWKRMGLWAFAPLAINLLYNFWTSIALLSGQRFLLTMDWSIIMYYLIGLFMIITSFMYLLDVMRPTVLKWYQIHGLPVANGVVSGRTGSQFVLAGLAFFLVGASVPFSEWSFSNRYPLADQEGLREAFLSSPGFQSSGLDAACVRNVIRDHDLSGYQARALSPLYYNAGEGENTAKLGYAPIDQSRLVFRVVGGRYGVVILNTAGSPEFFPHAADVLFFLDRKDPYQAWFILVDDGQTQAVYMTDEPGPAQLCGPAD